MKQCSVKSCENNIKEGFTICGVHYDTLDHSSITTIEDPMKNFGGRSKKHGEIGVRSTLAPYQVARNHAITDKETPDYDCGNQNIKVRIDLHGLTKIEMPSGFVRLDHKEMEKLCKWYLGIEQ